MRLQTIWAHVRPPRIEELSEAAKWSSLRLIGQSPVVRLTIIMPFVGYLILFNAQLLSFLRLSIPVQFNLLYFGLLCLGLGSFLFTMFAPEQVKLHSSPADYIKHLESYATYNITTTSLDRILDAFVQTDEEVLNIRNRLSLPDHVTSKIGQFINQVFEATKFDNDDDDNEGHLTDTTESGDDIPFYTASGYINTSEVARIMWANPKVTWVYSRPLIATAAESYKTDIFYLDYLILDYSKHVVRLAVAALFALGFVLLIIPTVRTSLLVLGATFGFGGTIYQ